MKMPFRKFIAAAALCGAPIGGALAGNPPQAPAPVPGQASTEAKVDQVFSNGGYGPCCPKQSCCTPCCPSSYGSIGVIFLDRSRGGNHGLTIDDSSPPGGTNREHIVLETNDLDYGFEGAPLITFGHWIDRCTAIEATYFGVWHGDDASSGQNAAQELDAWFQEDDDFLEDNNFFDAFEQTAEIDTELQSFEVNMRRGESIWNSYFVGLRYIYLAENFTFTSFDEGPADPTVLGFYDIDTYNHMIGPQIGGSTARSISNNCVVGVNGTAGLLLNFARQNNRILAVDAAGTEADDSRGDEDVDFSTLVQLGVFTGYTVSDSCALQLGYNVLFLNGVALATDQIDSAPNRANSRDWLSDAGDVVYHGPTASAVFLW